jgi:hypothetical protein
VARSHFKGERKGHKKLTARDMRARCHGLAWIYIYTFITLSKVKTPNPALRNKIILSSASIFFASKRRRILHEIFLHI